MVQSFSSPLVLPPCRVPGAWTGPHQHSCGHGGPAPTSQYQLLWQQTEVRVPRRVSITEGLLWLCLDCPCAVHPTPDLPVSPCHTAHGRCGAGGACTGGQQSWECRGVTVQLGCGWPEPLPKCGSLKEYQVCDGSESFHQMLHWQLKEWSVWEWGKL